MERAKVFLCQKHQNNRIICKCAESKWKPVIQQNSTNVVNQASLVAVGFDTEWVLIHNKGVTRKALLAYDGFASHTTLNRTLKEELGLKEIALGEIEVQTYAGPFSEKSFRKDYKEKD